MVVFGWFSKVELITRVCGSMHDEMTDSNLDYLCHRCGVSLTPGEGSFYVVKIEAVADPTPPRLDTEEPLAEISADIDALIEQMRDLSEQELMDQVYRRVVVLLCRPCYEPWIEDPTGS